MCTFRKTFFCSFVAENMFWVYSRTCFKRLLKGPKNCGQLWFLKTGGLLTQVNYSENCTVGTMKGRFQHRLSVNAGCLKDRFDCICILNEPERSKNFILVVNTEVSFMDLIMIQHSDTKVNFQCMPTAKFKMKSLIQTLSQHATVSLKPECNVSDLLVLLYILLNRTVTWVFALWRIILGMMSIHNCRNPSRKNFKAIICTHQADDIVLHQLGHIDDLISYTTNLHNKISLYMQL